jgi:hypothetical protein
MPRQQTPSRASPAGHTTCLTRGANQPPARWLCSVLVSMRTLITARTNTEATMHVHTHTHTHAHSHTWKCIKSLGKGAFRHWKECNLSHSLKEKFFKSSINVCIRSPHICTTHTYYHTLKYTRAYTRVYPNIHVHQRVHITHAHWHAYTHMC